MSIAPYNSLTVRDLNGNQQSYVNSTTEVGYFTGEYSGTIPKGRIFSLPVFLKTNNGIASVDSTNGMFGLRILNSGVYKINLSLFPTSTQDGSSNISFNFGTSQVLYDSSFNVVNAFGGVSAIGMYTYDLSNNPSFPGIISWVADGYSIANSRISNFVQNPLTYELAYNYNNAGYLDKKLYSGISTTEMTFVVDSSVNIFFNVHNNSNADITMGDCCFTLKLMTTPFTRVRTWKWTLSDALNSSIHGWWNMRSSQTGQYLAAIASYPYNPQMISSELYISSNYGANWISSSAGLRRWWGLTSSASGQYLAATVVTGLLYRSSNYGVDWIESGPTPVTTIRNWRDITSSIDGSRLAAITIDQGLYVSKDFGVTWSLLTSSVSGARISMSQSMQYFCVAGGPGPFFASTNGGITWRTSNPSSSFWGKIESSIDGKNVYLGLGGTFFKSNNYGVNLQNFGGIGGTQTINQIATSSNGQYLAAATSQLNSGVYLSSNYGITWTKQQTITGLPAGSYNSIASSGDGTRLAVGLVSGGIYIGVYS